MSVVELLFGLSLLLIVFGRSWMAWSGLVVTATFAPGLVVLPSSLHPVVIAIVAMAFRFWVRGSYVTPASKYLALGVAAGLATASALLVTKLAPAAPTLVRPEEQILAVGGILLLLLRRVDPRERDQLRIGLAIVSVGLALAAVEESSRGTYFYAASKSIFRVSTRGSIRAQIWMQQPLLLSLLLTFGVIAIATLNVSRLAKVVGVLVVVAGIEATGSRTPIVCLGVFAALIAVRRLPPLPRLFLGAGGLIASVFVLGPILQSASNSLGSATSLEDLSSTYRLALYRAAFTDVGHHPFGRGLAGLPRGQYLVDTSFGIKDIAQSVDNTFLVVMIMGGWFAVAVLIWATVLMFRRWITCSREVLALHVALLASALSFSLASFIFTAAIAPLVLFLAGSRAEDPLPEEAEPEPLVLPRARVRRADAPRF